MSILFLVKSTTPTTLPSSPPSPPRPANRRRTNGRRPKEIEVTLRSRATEREMAPYRDSGKQQTGNFRASSNWGHTHFSLELEGTDFKSTFPTILRNFDIWNGENM
ncbi:MAG: hypothetical protein RIC06_22915 [Cyclobacteriaceae bacterium]